MPTLSRTHLLSFIFAAGILATLHMGLRFALVDQQAMLPGILHLSDPSLYSRDFGYSSGLTYGPRFYAFHMMGFLGGLLGHELATVVVVLLINGLVLYMTYRVAEQLFQGSRLAPIFAVVLVGVLGSAIIPLHPIITPEWDPRAMGMPFAFACLWAILRNRPMVAAIIAAVGSLIHPLLLINTAVIAFGGFGIGKLLDLTSAPRADRTRIFRDILWLIAAGLVFAIATYLTWILPYSVGAVSDNRLFEILRFRTPRSYELLKFWGIRGFIHLGIFIAGVAFAWTWWVRERVSEKHLANRVAGLIAMTLIMLAGAVIFVEFIPIRAWLMADASSGIYAARWLGLLLIARSAAVLIENTSAIREGAWSGAAMLVSGSGLALPALSLFGHLIEVLRRRLVRWMDATALVIVMISGLVVAGFLLAAFGSLQDSFGLVLLGAFALPFVIFP